MFKKNFLWLILLEFFGVSWSLGCPKNCHCFLNVESQEINCSNGNFYEAPKLTSNFETIYLSHNHLSEFPRPYSTIKTLRYLDLSDNEIKSLDQFDLAGFDSLIYLNLENNQIKSWFDLDPNEAFLQTKLKYLILSGNQFKHFNNDDREEALVSPTLIELNLRNCNIQAVGGDMLMNNLPKLETLNLSDNNISSIDILPSRTLTYLQISNSGTKILSSYFFQGLTELKFLNVSRNPGIQFISPNNADDFISDSLQILDLSYCGMDDLKIKGFPNLQHLHFQYNMLRYIRDHHLAANVHLETLDFSNNHLLLLEPLAFSSLANLRKIDFSFNQLNRLDHHIFESNNELVSLNLSHNEFKELPLCIILSLKEIDLTGCQLDYFDPQIFGRLPHLQTLILKSNFIRHLPSKMKSDSLQNLYISNNRLSSLSDYVFDGFLELSRIDLRKNLLKHINLTTLFGHHKYLNQVLLSGNPFECNCDSQHFQNNLYFIQRHLKEISSRQRLTCVAPMESFGKAWEEACDGLILSSRQSAKGEKVWSTIMYSLLVVGGLIFVFLILQKLLKKHKKRRDERELRHNTAEMEEIRRLNARILRDGNNSSNAPSAYELSALPSYEDALRMPKLQRPAKSMVDLTITERHKAKFKRSRTLPEENISDIEDDLLVDKKTRFHSVEMLANRDKERMAYMMPNRRCDILINNDNYNHRQLSIEASRFPSSFLKSQNLQSAERIGNFQSYENSPYSKRRLKIQAIPPFRRATLQSNSVEFLTEPELDPPSKPNSPFAQRKPKPSPIQPLQPAIEDHFGSNLKASPSSSEGSGFQMVVGPEVSSTPKPLKQNYFLPSSVEETESTEQDPLTMEKGKRKKRRNSNSRRASGNFTSNNLGNLSTSSSDEEPIVVIHKPIRETLF